MRTKPAAIVPTIAPIVFAAYSFPKEPLSSEGSRLRYRVRVGSVAPMRTVAGPSATSASPKRTSASRLGLPSSVPNAPR